MGFLPLDPLGMDKRAAQQKLARRGGAACSGGVWGFWGFDRSSYPQQAGRKLVRGESLELRRLLWEFLPEVFPHRLAKSMAVAIIERG